MIIIFRWDKNESYQKLWKDESISFSLFINRTVCQVMIYHLNSLKQLTQMPFLSFHTIKIKMFQLLQKDGRHEMINSIKHVIKDNFLIQLTLI